MKKILGLFLSLLIPVIALAQNQGDDVPLGSGGTKMLCAANESQVAMSGSGKLNFSACDRFGQLIPQAISPFMAYGLNDTAETGSTATNIIATAHAVKVGDIVMFGVTSAARGGSSYVTSIATNSFTITPPLRAAPSNGDFFYIGRPMPPAVDSNNGFLILTPKTMGGVPTAYVEEGTPANGDGGVPPLGKVLATPVSQTADGKYGNPVLNDLNAQYVDGVRRGATWTAANPSMTTATSTQIAGANAARRYLLVQNNSAANICVSTTGATLTGIVPSSTNVCITIAAGASWISPPNACPVTNITAYQTSGGTITSVSVIEGF